MGAIRRGIEQWLEPSEYDSVRDIRGIVSQLHAKDQVAFEQANYGAVRDSFTPSTGA